MSDLPEKTIVSNGCHDCQFEAKQWTDSDMESAYREGWAYGREDNPDDSFEKWIEQYKAEKLAS